MKYFNLERLYTKTSSNITIILKEKNSLLGFIDEGTKYCFTDITRLYLRSKYNPINCRYETIVSFFNDENIEINMVFKSKGIKSIIVTTNNAITYSPYESKEDESADE